MSNKMVIVYTKETEKHANYLMQLISIPSREEDEQITVACWSLDEFKNSMSKMPSNRKVLFVGDNSGFWLYDAHPFMSVICMYDIFDCSGKEGKRYAWKLGQIIIAHKGDFCPPKDVAKEAAILRMADKIDKYNKFKYRLKKARKSYEKNLEKIREYFRGNGLDDKFKQIKTACEHERKKAEKRRINAT